MIDDLIPFEPMSIYYHWFLCWKEHVRCAKSVKENEGYCLAACIAQMSYVTELAIRKNKLKNVQQ